MLFVFLIGLTALLFYPGIVILQILRRKSLINGYSDMMVNLYLSFALGVLYWVFMSLILFSFNVLRTSLVIGIIIALGLPIGLFLIDSMLNKNLTTRSQNSSDIVDNEGFPRDKNNSMAVLALSVMIIFFLVAMIFEALDCPLPAGFDRNKHLAYVVWFIWNRTIMENYVGTAYNNFYPVGMHMFLAILFIIVMALTMGSNVLQAPISPENFVVISEAFVFMGSLIIAMYPLALHTLLCLVTRNHDLNKYTLLSSLMILGYVVVVEPIHMLLGNILIPFVFLACIASKFSKKKSDRIIYGLLVMITISSVLLIHIYAAVYHLLTVMAVELAYKARAYRSKESVKSIFRLLSNWIKVAIKGALSVALFLLASLAIITSLYPGYIFGIRQESVRVSNSPNVLAELSRYSQTQTLWSVYNPRDPRFLPLYISSAINALLIPFILTGCLIMLLFGLKIATSLRNNKVRKKPQISNMDYRKTIEFGFLFFLIFSAFYTLFPIIPKFGITEVKALFLLPILLGALTKATIKEISYVIMSLKRGTSNVHLISKRVGMWMALLLLVSAIMTTIVVIRSLSFSRVGGYINFSEVKQLAQVINLNVRKEYTIVYPDGSRQMELLILETLVKNKIILASISTDLPQQIELARIYKYCYVWKRGAYYSFAFNSSAREILEIIVSNHIGAIISNPFFILDYEQILSLFPNARIIRISSYYTITILFPRR